MTLLYMLKPIIKACVFVLYGIQLKENNTESLRKEEEELKLLCEKTKAVRSLCSVFVIFVIWVICMLWSC